MKMPAAKLELDASTVAACSTRVAVVVIEKKSNSVVAVKVATRAKGLDIIAEVSKQYADDHFIFALCTLSPTCEVRMFEAELLKQHLGEGDIPLPPSVGHA
jgi:hypothetical protein